MHMCHHGSWCQGFVDRDDSISRTLDPSFFAMRTYPRYNASKVRSSRLSNVCNTVQSCNIVRTRHGGTFTSTQSADMGCDTHASKQQQPRVHRLNDGAPTSGKVHCATPRHPITLTHTPHTLHILLHNVCSGRVVHDTVVHQIVWNSIG